MSTWGRAVGSDREGVHGRDVLDLRATRACLNDTLDRVAAECERADRAEAQLAVLRGEMARVARLSMADLVARAAA